MDGHGVSKVGLTSAEARRRLERDGPNEAVAPRRYASVIALLARFKNPLIILLIIAAVLSGVLGDRTSAVIIIAIVVLSTLLDFLNTYKSEQAAEALKARVRVSAAVYRDGAVQELPVRCLVVGDVVELKAGDIIPADGTVLEGEHFYVNEAVLTGEAFPKPKEPNAALYEGSSTVSGDGLMLVTATARNTKFSRIAASITSKEPPTEFDHEIRDFSVLIIRITFGLVLFIFLVNALLKHNLLDSLLFSVALAVGLTPELLPMIITLNLTKGSLAMAKRGVIVKRLSAIQNFGSMDVLCTDKTGTLTEDKIVLIKYVDAAGKPSEDVLHHAYVSSTFESGFKSPLDEAVKNYRTIDISDYHKVDEIPFDFERRRASVVVRSDRGLSLITKGAPEQILKICTFHTTRERSMTDAGRAAAIRQYQALSRDGFRVLAVAARQLRTHERYDAHDEAEMTLLGFIAFLDPAKKTVSGTLKRMRQNGIDIKILTGDNDLVTEKIARDIHLKIQGVLTGAEITKLDDPALAEKIEGTTIFARVDPEQKMRIIRLLQANGHVVGYMGDGINDAPSLRAADTGISVNNAVDIAKDTADLILVHKSLADLIEGVIEGRRTFANTVKYLKMALSSNFGNMFSMAGASLLLPFLPMLAPQILLNNLLYDSSQFALPLDTVDTDAIQRPQKLSIRALKRFMLVFGPLSSIFDFITFGVLYGVFHLTGGEFQTGWFVESIATQTFVIYILRTRHLPFVQSRPSWYLTGSTVLAVAAGCFVAYGGLGHFFHFSPLHTGVNLAVAGIVLAYLVAIQLAKGAFYRRVSF
ncbi:MAG TPA: magnesium-translocating P-type ATPase [Candidatus Saccharimonadales bacterium]|nr:magnesium-translocating P-type ATPase [Candidatus Saccharimonadales bacterium]